MHLLLTDVLACPRCGPEFGLILRADAMSDRRIEAGVLGCANCRDNFPVRDGFVDLRPPPRTDDPAGREVVFVSEPTDETDRLRAMLGLVRGPGAIALVGAPTVHAAALAGQVEGLQVAAFEPGLVGESDRSTVSRGRIASVMPFFTQRIRGVAIGGGHDAELLREAARVVGRGGRVVLSGASPDDSETLADAGLTILVEEAETVVAARN